jgi:hypothetical protein
MYVMSAYSRRHSVYLLQIVISVCDAGFWECSSTTYGRVMAESVSNNGGTVPNALQRTLWGLVSFTSLVHSHFPLSLHSQFRAT